MPIRYHFEDAATGDDITLNPDLTYEIVKSYVDMEGDYATITHRVVMKGTQYIVEDGRLKIIDLSDVPDDLSGLEP